MKICNIINTILLLSLFNFNKSNELIKSIIPDEKLLIKGVQLNKEILINADIDNFLQLQKYKIMVHYFGSY